MRHMYVVQALPDRARINALDSRTVIYMDSEMWFEPYIDTYDRSGHLFRSISTGSPLAIARCPTPRSPSIPSNARSS